MRVPHQGSAAASPQLAVEVVQGVDRGQKALLSGGEIHLGRAGAERRAGTWITFTERTLSALHATLLWDEARGLYRLLHRSSTNCTLVNGLAVEETLLRPGDTIQMGRVTLRLVAAGPTAEARDPSPVRLGREEAAFLFAQLSLMLDAGISLARALEGLAEHGGTPALRQVARELLLGVTTGSSPGEAMRRLPGAFTALHVHTVEAGVAGGLLAGALKELAACEERDLLLRRRVASSLTYPLCVFCIGVLLVLVVSNYVFSTLLPLLQGGAQLPLATQALVWLTQALHSPVVIVLLLLGAAALVAGIRRALRDDRVRDYADRRILSAPVVGPVVHRMALVRFSRCLGLLHASGLPMTKCLEVAAACGGNSAIRKAVWKARDHLQDGEPLFWSLQQTGLFPDLLVSMVAIGESLGTLEKTLARASALYDGEVEDTLSTAVRLLEPLAVVAMGALVGFVALAALLPVYRLVATF